MRKYAVILCGVAVWGMAAACGAKKPESSMQEYSPQTEAAAFGGEEGKAFGTVQEDSYVGIYHDYAAGEPSLLIGREEDGIYRVTVSYFHMKSFENMEGTLTDDGIAFEARDPLGNPLCGIIVQDGGTAAVVLTKCTWKNAFNIEKGMAYYFFKADGMSGDALACRGEGDAYVGVYNSFEENEPGLFIEKDGDAYRLQIGLFRLTTLQDVEGTLTDDGISFRTADPMGSSLSGVVTLVGQDAVVTFADASWDYIHNGDTYYFTGAGKADPGGKDPYSGSYFLSGQPAGQKEAGYGLWITKNNYFKKDGTYCIDMELDGLAGFGNVSGILTDDGVLFFTLDPDGRTLCGLITLDGKDAVVTFTDSSWRGLEAGREFRFMSRKI